MASLSVSMALESLRDTCRALTQAEAVVARERAIRDALIRDARAAGVSYRTVSNITGLTRDRIYAVVNSAPEDV